MFYGLLSVRDFGLKALDGEIGLCDDFLFDDRDWSVCHMVAMLDTWAHQKRKLIPHHAFGLPDKHKRLFKVNLTKAQIRLADPLTKIRSAPDRQRTNFARLFLVQPGRKAIDPPLAAHAEAGGKHLHSVFKVSKYQIQASDGLLGFVDDFLVEGLDDEIRYLVLNFGHCSSGKRTIIPPEWITSVDWQDHQIKLNRARNIVEKQPSYEPGNFL